jgi:hypothetical protein
MRYIDFTETTVVIVVVVVWLGVVQAGAGSDIDGGKGVFVEALM